MTNKTLHPSPRSPDQPAGPAHVGKAPIAPGSADPARGAGLPLPHERDESTGSVDSEPRAKMVRAKRDLDAGLVDTDMRATPGLDAERRARLVPTPAAQPAPAAPTRPKPAKRR